MKVLYVLTRDDKFGAPRALMEMVGTLKDNYNIEPVILTPKKNKINKLCDKLKIENYSIIYGTAMKIKGQPFINIARFLVYIYGNLFSLRKISNIIDFKNIDFIHTNDSVIDFGYKLSKKFNKKHIWHIREFADLDFNYYPFNKDYIACMNNSYNVAISNVIKNHWNKKGVNNIELIYDGIDLETIKEKKNYIKSKLKFIFIGSLCEGKGQLDFINSITKLDDEILNKIELHLFGSGDSKYISKIQNTIYKNNLSNIVFLDGYNENIRNEIKKFNIGIVNSKSEAFGRVTAEYMATGLCVLASNTGANQELIDNNKNGLIFEYKNYEDIRKKIMYLYNNQNLIKKYGISARKKINTNFSKEKNAENVYKLYMKVMGD